MTHLSPQLQAIALTGFDRWKLVSRGLLTLPKCPKVRYRDQSESNRKYRAKLLKMGLTANGTPRKPVKKRITPQEKREYGRRYNQEYRDALKAQGLTSRGTPRIKRVAV